MTATRVSRGGLGCTVLAVHVPVSMDGIIGRVTGARTVHSSLSNMYYYHFHIALLLFVTALHLLFGTTYFYFFCFDT